MIDPRLTVTALLALFSICGASLVAQNQSGRTIGELLREHRIELTRPALIDALRSPDQEVRWLAAMKLADDGAREAVPAILAALKDKSERSESQINIAIALERLGSPAGRETLIKICNDSAVSPGLRLQSAGYLARSGESACVNSVIQVLATSHDDDVRMEALRLLPSMAKSVGADQPKISKVLLTLLKDDNPSVRLSSAISIAELGDKSAAPELKAAIATEKEDAIQSQMRIELRLLERQTNEK